MRIIAGKYKGKVLKEFNLKSTRPTTDMVREALFDKIGTETGGSIFLDLFSGTGAVGIEALSRGAKLCYFADSNADAVKIIKSNLNLIDAQNYILLNLDYKIMLKNLSKDNIKFDIIFLDPPYATSFAEDAIDIIKQNKLISPNGVIVWEHDVDKNDYIKNNFTNFQTKKYGKKYLTYISNCE